MYKNNVLCLDSFAFLGFYYTLLNLFISPTSNCSQLTKSWTQPAEDALKHQKAGSFYKTMEDP